MDQVRELSDWRLWQLINDEFKAALQGVFPFRVEFVVDAIESVKERPRRRKLQGLPPRVLEIIQWCRGLGLSCV